MSASNLFDQYMIRYKAGDIVFLDGERGEEMYIVHAGAVEVCKELDGRRTVLSRLEKGDFFGEMAILENLPRSATVQVVEDAILIRINKATFEALLKSNIEIAIRMLRKYSIRLREANMEIERLHQRRSKGGAIRITSRSPQPGTPSILPGEEAEPIAPEVVHEAPSAAPPAAPAPEAHAILAKLVVKESGHEFAISDPEITVGRRDPVTGAHPDIDLSSEDMVRSVSRRHAKIIHQDAKFYIMEEVGVANGTFLNGERLQTGERRPLAESDELKFGLVATVFMKAAAKDAAAESTP